MQFDGRPMMSLFAAALRRRAALLVLALLLGAVGSAQAQSGCGFFERKIRFADGQEGCASEFAFLRQEGLIANESGTSYAAKSRASATYAIALTADPQSCPFASYMAWNWSGRDAAEALPKCNERMAEALRRVGSSAANCRCETVVDTARSALSRKDFEARLALVEKQYRAGGAPLALQVPVLVANGPAAVPAAAEPAVVPAATAQAQADLRGRQEREAEEERRVAQDEARRQADARAAAQVKADREAEARRLEAQRVAQAKAEADAAVRRQQQAESDRRALELQRRQDDEKARAAEAARIAAQARQADDERDRLTREMAELRRRLEEQTRTQEAAAAQLSLPANYTDRVALVVGNTSYLERPLVNPGNDARVMRTRLLNIGFKVLYFQDVKVGQIGDVYEQLNAALQAKPGAAFVFYYAGHGTQIDGENFFPAVDAKMASKFHMPSQSLDPGRIIKIAESARSAVRLMILDACRDNPWQTASRGMAKGLNKLDPAEGTLILHATRPGSVAIDESRGDHGLFTYHLLRHFDTPRLPVERLFKVVAADVRVDSGGRQVPWIEGQLVGDFAFRER